MSKVLLCEVDGYNVHLSLTGPGIRPELAVRQTCGSLDELDSAIGRFIHDAGQPRLIAGAFCAPGPVRDDAIQLTHAPMRIDRSRLRNALGASRVHLLNDFTACALAVPLLDPREVERVGDATPEPDAPIGVIGPWRGLGVSTLAPDSSGEWTPLPGEGGHIAVAAINDRESEVLAVLRHRLGRISAEEVTTEPGLINLQNALAQLADAPALANVEAILQAAKAGEPTAREAIRLFTGWVGDIAGNLALMVGARGGIYIFSALMATHPQLFDRALLRERFEDKGKMRGFMEGIPLFMVSTREAGLLGLSTLFSPADSRMM
ncbi:MAG: Glucokinase [Caulobacteraceae bacterium]|nr:Glucokinase [Caulobacteraceae bacterium]